MDFLPREGGAGRRSPDLCSQTATSTHVGRNYQAVRCRDLSAGNAPFESDIRKNGSFVLPANHKC